jgi:hypothetical protein
VSGSRGRLVCENVPFLEFFGEGEYSKLFGVLAMKTGYFPQKKTTKNVIGKRNKTLRSLLALEKGANCCKSVFKNSQYLSKKWA